MISPIENNGMMLRTQDYSILRQNEDNYSANQHVQIQDRLDKSDDANAHSVNTKDDANGPNTHHDARDEGRNKYVDMRNKKKKQDDELNEGKVIAKSQKGFDISI